MLRDLFEYGRSIREEMKATVSEIKKNPQGTNSEGREVRVQINNLEHKEEINIQWEQKEETRIQKNKESIRGVSKCANTQITGVPEGEEEEQESENLFEKIMQENFSNLVKEIDIQVQEAESQTNWTQRGPCQDTS